MYLYLFHTNMLLILFFLVPLTGIFVMYTVSLKGKNYLPVLKRINYKRLAVNIVLGAVFAITLRLYIIEFHSILPESSPLSKKSFIYFLSISSFKALLSFYNNVHTLDNTVLLSEGAGSSSTGSNTDPGSNNLVVGGSSNTTALTPSNNIPTNTSNNIPTPSTIDVPASVFNLGPSSIYNGQHTPQARNLVSNPRVGSHQPYGRALARALRPAIGGRNISPEAINRLSPLDRSYLRLMSQEIFNVDFDPTLNPPYLKKLL